MKIQEEWEIVNIGGETAYENIGGVGYSNFNKALY